MVDLAKGMSIQRREYVEASRYLEDQSGPFFVDVEALSGFTPLMLACSADDIDAIAMLIDRGADTRKENRLGHTCLSWAAVCNNSQAVKFLLHRGADAYQKSEYDCKTALIHTSYHGSEKAASALLNFYSERALKCRVDNEETDWIGPLIDFIQHRDRYDKSALEWAQKQNHSSVVHLIQRLISHAFSQKAIGQDVQEIPHKGKMDRFILNPLHRASNKTDNQMKGMQPQTVTCGLCKMSVPVEKEKRHEHDACIKRIVRCSRYRRGCEIFLAWENMQHHFQSDCDYRDYSCTKCGDNLVLIDRISHDKNHCPFRLITCTDCEDGVQANDIKKHKQNDCSHRLIICSVGCGKRVLAKNLMFHQERECAPKCKWKGCSEKIGSEDARNIHEKYICPSRWVSCSNCNDEDIPADRLNLHQRKTCPHTVQLREEAANQANAKSPPSHLRRCNFDLVGKRVLLHSSGEVECPNYMLISDFRLADGMHKVLTSEEGYKWQHLFDLDFDIIGNENWVCGWVEDKKMKAHIDEDCSLRPIVCKLGCGQRLPRKCITDHETKHCSKRIVACSLGCKEEAKEEEMKIHEERECCCRSILCDLCAAEVTLSSLDDHKIHHCVLRNVLCPKGCGSKVLFGELDGHLEKLCPKRLVSCKQCGNDELFAEELEGHLDGSLRNSDCPFLVDFCNQCDAKVIAKNIAHHKCNICPMRLVLCELCGIEVHASKMTDHRVADCEGERRYCTLGCKCKVAKRDVERHQKEECAHKKLTNYKATIQCRLRCGIELSPHDNLFLHITKECPKRLISCGYFCGEIVSAEELENHKLLCPRRFLPCGYNSPSCARAIANWTAVDEGGDFFLGCERHHSNALMWGIVQNDNRLVRFFLGRVSHEDISIETNFGDTALTLAAKIGNVETLILLLRVVKKFACKQLVSEVKFINNETSRGKTALVEAARNNHLEAVKLLLFWHARASYTTKVHQKSALDWVLRMVGKCDVAEELERAVKLEKDAENMFCSISLGNIDEVKEVIKNGDKFEINQIHLLEREIKAVRSEKAQLGDDLRNMRCSNLAEQKETASNLAKSCTTLKHGISEKEDKIAELGKQIKDKALESSKIFKTAMASVKIAMTHKCVCQLTNTLHPGKYIFCLSKVLCMLLGIDLTDEIRHSPEDCWEKVKVLMRGEHAYHRLRHVNKECIEPTKEKWLSGIIQKGCIDYDLSHKLLLGFSIDGREELVKNQSADASGGNILIAALTKWAKAVFICLVNIGTSKKLESEIAQKRNEVSRLSNELVCNRNATLLQQQKIDITEEHLRRTVKQLDSSTMRTIELTDKIHVAKLMNYTSPSGHTLLTWASAVGNVEIVEELLERGSHNGLGDQYFEWCSRIIQAFYRYYVWKKVASTKPQSHATKLDMQKRSIALMFYMRQLGKQMSLHRLSLRAPLLEAFFNGHPEVATAFERKGISLYQNQLPWREPCGVIPRSAMPMNVGVCHTDHGMPFHFVESALRGKDRFQTPFWAHGMGWIPASNYSRDPFSICVNAAFDLTDRLLLRSKAGVHDKVMNRTSMEMHEQQSKCRKQLKIAINEGNFKKIISTVEMSDLDIDWETESGITPLLRAALEDVKAVNHMWCISDTGENVTAVAYLCDHILDRPTIDHETKIGHTALTFACFHGRLEAVEALLDRGASINRQSCTGRTALMFAALSGNHHVARLLLERGSDLQVQDNEGMKAYDHAYTMHQDVILSIFAKTSRGNIGQAKVEFGQKYDIVPCQWGCGVFDTWSKLENDHHRVCEWRPVICSHCKKHGIKVREKEIHESGECVMKPIECLMCKEFCPSKDLEEHQKSSCPKRIMSCPLNSCAKKIRAENLDRHIQYLCHFRTTTCANGCGADVVMTEMILHLQQMCSKRTIRCKNCGIKLIAASVRQHETSDCQAREIACSFCSQNIPQKNMEEHHSSYCSKVPTPCTNARQGCTWYGSKDKKNNHCSLFCDFSFRVKCPLGCKILQRQVDINKHTTKECCRRVVSCISCRFQCIAASLEDHVKYDCSKT